MIAYLNTTGIPPDKKFYFYAETFLDYGDTQFNIGMYQYYRIYRDNLEFVGTDGLIFKAPADGEVVAIKYKPNEDLIVFQDYSNNPVKVNKNDEMEWRATQ